MNPAPGAPNYPIASIYVDDLAADVTEAMLFEKFSIVGAVLSIRVCRDIETRRSLSHAYVNFQQPAAAERALDAMNFDPIRGRPCCIMSSQRDPSLRKSRVWNIFIKNLDKSIDNKALYDTFSAFGNILSCKIAQAEDGTSNGYGFVHFDTEEAADNAIGKVNGMLLNGKEVYATKWMSRRERQEKLGNQPKKMTNVYVKSFGEDMDEEHFKELADNIKVILGGSGRSKGFGFVSYGTPEEAQKAAGQQVGQVFPQAGAFYMQPLAQRKDPPLTLSALAAASMQYHKQIIGERLYPLIQATQPKQVGKITGMLLELDNVELLHMLESPEALAAKIQEAVSVLRAYSAKEEKQIIGERLYPLIKATQPKQVGKITGMLLELDNVELLHMLESREALAAMIQEAVSVLRAHSAKEEKQIIGERLYPLIKATHPKQVGKITGMLLELDNVELLHMLESPEALAAKIQEAVSVLRAYSAKKKSAEMKN